MGLWSSIKKGAKKAWNGIKKAAKTVYRAVKNVVKAFVSIVRRIMKILGFIGSLLGIRPRKQMMLRIVILKNDQGLPVVPRREVERWVSVAKHIYLDRCNVQLTHAHLTDAVKQKYFEDGISLPTEFPIVAVAEKNAPDEALDVPGATISAWNGDLDYFRQLLGAEYAKPTVTGSVVRDVSGGSRGFAWGMITDIFLVDPTALSTSVAHEMGHLCWLLHRKKAGNLMTPGRADAASHLTRWQISVIRSSKYATYGG